MRGAPNEARRSVRSAGRCDQPVSRSWLRAGLGSGPDPDHTPLGFRWVRYRALDEATGEALWPEVHGAAELYAIRDTDPLVFGREFQNEPRDDAASMFPYELTERSIAAGAALSLGTGNPAAHPEVAAFPLPRLRRGARPARRRPGPRAENAAHPRRPRAGPVARDRDELPEGGRDRGRAAPLADRAGRAPPLGAQEGARLEAARAAESEAIFGAHPDRRSRPRRGGTVWVSADGTMVHDRASGTEPEVKIGLVFDGARRVGRTRRVLTGRTLDAGTESWTAWAERFTALCTRLGVFEAERILFVTDGAASIRWIRERSFPSAIELLDWYHLVEALRGAIGPGRPGRLELALVTAAPGDAERLLELLAGWAAEEAGRDPERSGRLAAVWGYVATNRQAIENYRIVPLASSGRWRRPSTSWLPDASRPAA